MLTKIKKPSNNNKNHKPAVSQSGNETSLAVLSFIRNRTLIRHCKSD